MKCVFFRITVRTVLRNAVLLVIIFFCTVKAFAQEWDHEYVLFAEEGKVWNCCCIISPYTYPDETINCIFTMYGDTLIGEKNYKKVFCQFEEYYGDEGQHYYCAVREEAHQVFLVEAGTKDEKFLYDFSHPQELLMLSYDNKKFIRDRGYHPLYFPTKQLSFSLYRDSGNEINHDYWLSDWIEGVGLVYGNPFICGLHSNEIDPLFGYPMDIVSCIKDEKCLFEFEWMAEISEPTSIRPTFKSAPDISIYDLQGRRLSAKPQKGVYIQNGKKYVMK